MSEFLKQDLKSFRHHLKGKPVTNIGATLRSVANLCERSIDRIDELEAENAKLQRILRQVGLHAEAEDE